MDMGKGTVTTWVVEALTELQYEGAAGITVCRVVPESKQNRTDSNIRNRCYRPLVRTNRSIPPSTPPTLQDQTQKRVSPIPP